MSVRRTASLPASVRSLRADIAERWGGRKSIMAGELFQGRIGPNGKVETKCVSLQAKRRQAFLLCPARIGNAKQVQNRTKEQVAHIPRSKCRHALNKGMKPNATERIKINCVNYRSEPRETTFGAVLRRSQTGIHMATRCQPLHLSLLGRRRHPPAQSVRASDLERVCPHADIRAHPPDRACVDTEIPAAVRGIAARSSWRAE